MNNIKIKINGEILTVILRDDADDSVVGEIFRHNEYRSVEDIIKNSEDVIIDVGAHAGFFTLFARALNKNVKIIAIEPEPNNLRSLREHLRINNINNVTVIDGAVAADSGRRHLILSKDSHNHHLAKRGKISEESLVVNSWSLSEILKNSIINSVSLVKIDIEGGEYEMFDTLDEAVFSKIKYFFIEYHESGDKKREVIENKLRENGFGVRVIPSKFDKKMGFILANNKRIK